MPEHAQVSVVAGALISQDGKILLVQEKQPRAYGKWNFPAGRVDAGESIEQAAIRETKEESGYDVELDQPLPIIHTAIDRPVIHIFTAHVTGGEIRIPEDEILAAKWFTLGEIRAMPTELRSEMLILGSLAAFESSNSSVV